MPDRRDALVDFVSFAERRFDATKYDVVESIESLAAEWRVDYERRLSRESMATPSDDALTPEEFEDFVAKEIPGGADLIAGRREEIRRSEVESGAA